MDGGALRTGRAETAALATAVLPTIVMVIRAWAAGWVPLFDAAYFTVRSRDVLTSHNPLVGAWSNGSREVGAWVNNLGPLQLDLLAPFTKLDPYWGTAVGVGFTNVAAIVGVWLVSRRLCGTLGVLAAMAATVLVQLNEGSLMLIEARQQLAMILPLWCLLWLAAAAWAGHRWAAPWIVFVASLVLQTHLTFAYQTIAVAVSALVALAVRRRANVRALAPTSATCAAVFVVCWALPVWDQLFSTGNLATVLGESGGSDRSVGVSKGWSILAESVFVPPFFVPGSMGDLLRRGARPSLAVSVIALAVWVALLTWVAVRLRIRAVALPAMAAVGVVALASSAYASIKIPPTEQFGIVAQNYYWSWPIGIFAATAIVGAATRRPLGRLVARLPGRWPAAHYVLAGLTVVACLPLLTPTNELPETRHEWSVSRHLARPLMDELREGLDGVDFDAPVLVDLGAVRHVRYTLLAELQRRNIDFRFAPGTTDLSRFGRDRCDDGSAAWLLSLRGGDQALRLDASDSRETLLASVPGLTDSEFDRESALAGEFGDALRSGSVVVHDSVVTDSGAELPPTLDQVRSTAGLSARRLSRFLSDWTQYGAVDIPTGLRSDFREWRDLELAAANDRMAIYLRPISPDRADRCDTLEPGTVS